MLARGGGVCRGCRCVSSSSSSSSSSSGASRSLLRRPALMQQQQQGLLRAALVLAASGGDEAPQPAPAAAASSGGPTTSAGAAAPTGGGGGGPTATTATAAAATAATMSSKTVTDWEQRRKQRLVRDLVEASRRLGPEFTPDALRAGCDTLEGLLPGLQIDVERLPAKDWARLALATPAAAAKVVLLKTLLPRAGLAAIVQREPKILLLESPQLEANVKQVLRLLREGGYGDAKDPDALLTALPSMLEPRVAMSVLVTVRKWYAGSKRSPVDILEADPQLVLRAQACGVPLDPVYGADDEALEAPGLAYLERRAPWQAYLDEKLGRNKKGQMAPAIPAPGGVSDTGDGSGGVDGDAASGTTTSTSTSSGGSSDGGEAAAAGADESAGDKK